jgi:hypothetical protein
MGTNNNVWGGKGDDVAYVIGEGIIARMAINFAIITSGY